MALKRLIILLTLTVSPAPALEGACEAVIGHSNCITPQPFQPDSTAMMVANRQYTLGREDFDFSMYGNTQSTILVDGVPYAQYWQLDNPNTYIFHPMVFGRYVYNNAVRSDLHSSLARLIRRVGINLPNGGLAPYYPNYYPLNRMRGPDLMYSAISQSEILAGYMRLAQHSKTSVVDTLVDRILQAHFMPYENGGIDLGVAQLELPLFRSNPEIILNGWLHALLHLNDYAITYNDYRVASYIERNLEFFADNYHAWYDENRNISRYSDTSPHRILVHMKDKSDDLALIYHAKDGRLSDYVYTPVSDTEGEYSGFDFRIINKNGNRWTVGITCSSLFNTYLVANDEFQLIIKGGGYSPYRATPDGSGEDAIIKSAEIGRLHAAEIALGDGELICGYPTNFSKANGKNVYHVQHIVALYYIAEASAYNNEELNGRLKAISQEWGERTSRFDEGKDLEFEQAQTVLDSINRGKLLNQVTDVQGLLELPKK